jgi:thioredoxin-like negative regulator of GroEL
VLQRRHNHDTFRLLRVDADERADLLERLSVRDVPSLLVVSDGRIQRRLANPRGVADIARFLSPWLK